MKYTPWALQRTIGFIYIRSISQDIPVVIKQLGACLLCPRAEPDEAMERLLDTACQACKQVEDTGGNPMLLCDSCDEGWHLGCLGPDRRGVDTMPSMGSSQWFCEKCRLPGMRVSVRMQTGRTRGAAQLKRGTILQVLPGGVCDVDFDDASVEAAGALGRGKKPTKGTVGSQGRASSR